jgi:integrase
MAVNPARNVREPKKPEPDFRFWTEKEINRFLAFTVVQAPQVYEVALVIVATGMRREELHQLQRDCLDFENRLITVKRSFSFISMQVKHTKAARIRRIPMHDEVFAVLAKHQAWKDPNRRIYEGVNIEHYHKHLRIWCEKADVLVVGLHDLRETFASSLVRSEKKIKVIQRLIGHVDHSVTQKYMHLDPSDLDGSTDCLLTGIPAPENRAPILGAMPPDAPAEISDDSRVPK